MAAPTVRNFGSFPPGDGDSMFGPGAEPFTLPATGYTWTVQTHDTVVVFISSSGVVSLADNVPGSPNTYVQVGGSDSPWWIAKNVVGGTAFQVTVTLSDQVQFPAAYIWDVAMASLNTPFEQQVSNTGTSPAGPSVDLTTTNVDDLILVGIAIAATPSPPNPGNGAEVEAEDGWTLDTSYTLVDGEIVYTPSAGNGTTPYGGAEHLGVSGTFSGTISLGITTGVDSYSAWTLYACAIRPAASAGRGQNPYIM